MSIKYPIRINKYLRDNGLCSRREADDIVNKGFVTVNNVVVESGYIVEENDIVKIKKQDKKYKYFAYYKPRGLSTQDLPGKKSVVTEWEKEGLYPIGRLDKESEGLLILTNDGRFAREVLSRKKEYEKEYLVTVREVLNPKIMNVMKKGMEIKSLGKLLPVKSEIINKNTIKIILNEGKRHQIRIMLNEFFYTVVSLKRVRIGEIKLGNLKPGEKRPLKIEL